MEESNLLFFLFQELYSFFTLGGFVIPVLTAVSILLWFVIGWRYHTIKRGSKGALRVLIKKGIRGELDPKKGIIDSAILEGIELAKKPIEDKKEYFNALYYKYEIILRQYNRLGVALVAIAPLLGLLGTVTGMIETFEAIASSELYSADGGGIIAGISEALYATQMGLAVAAPGLVIIKLLERQAEMIQNELEQIKDILCFDKTFMERIHETM